MWYCHALEKGCLLSVVHGRRRPWKKIAWSGRGRKSIVLANGAAIAIFTLRVALHCTPRRSEVGRSAFRSDLLLAPISIVSCRAKVDQEAKRLRE